MQVQIISEATLFVPQTEEERRLVRYVMESMLSLLNPGMVLWERLEAFDGPWMPASGALPILERVPGEEDEAPTPQPWIVICELALPINFTEATNLACKESSRMLPGAKDWFIKCLDEYVMGSDLEPFDVTKFDESQMVFYHRQLQISISDSRADRGTRQKEHMGWRRRRERHARDVPKQLRPVDQPVAPSPPMEDAAPPPAAQAIEEFVNENNTFIANTPASQGHHERQPQGQKRRRRKRKRGGRGRGGGSNDSSGNST
jgi:hypothetical protein